MFFSRTHLPLSTTAKRLWLGAPESRNSAEGLLIPRWAGWRERGEGVFQLAAVWRREVGDTIAQIRFLKMSE